MRLFGGSGDDTYFVDNAGDVITEAVNAGNDTVKTAINTAMRSPTMSRT